MSGLVKKLVRLVLGRPGDMPLVRGLHQYRFECYREARENLYGMGFAGLRSPGVRGLVSIIMPVFNGEKLVAEALASILSQTYRNFELIVVNDGSTDGTEAMVAEYATQDERIKLVNQENQRLPRALANGFRLAQGEYLTWTSDDNRLEPEFLARMVACLERHPDWDFTYANVQLIDDSGDSLCGSERYASYQQPPGSGLVCFPRDTGKLNTWPEQYVGSAFLYRDRVARLLGDYSAIRYTVEDYDFFMRANEFFTMRHVDFAEPIYQYRYHGGSLTAREEELRIADLREDLMVFDDFRRDLALSPLCWFIDPDGVQWAGAMARAVQEQALSLGHVVVRPGDLEASRLPRLWLPTVYIRFADLATEIAPPPASLPENTLTVIVVAGENCSLPDKMAVAWDLGIALGGKPALPALTGHQRGWFGVGGVEDLLPLVDIRAKANTIAEIEKEIAGYPRSSPLRFSIVLCTYQRSEMLLRALSSLGRLDYPGDQYEVILVNNDPQEDLDPVIAEIRETYFSTRPGQFRYFHAPCKGLSHARNAGISEARGEVICFIDDDAIAQPDWLTELDRAYEDEKAGVVGGKILLHLPAGTPAWVTPEIFSYWSHFDPGNTEIRWVDNWREYPWGANWTCRRLALLMIGGFRARYGRKGNDYSGGEEQLAAVLVKRLGFRVGLIPGGAVEHHVQADRFSRQHLRKTIVAGLKVNYGFQRDLYVPVDMGFVHELRMMRKHTLALLQFYRFSPAERLERAAKLKAECILLWMMLIDLWRRATLKWRLK